MTRLFRDRARDVFPGRGTAASARIFTGAAGKEPGSPGAEAQREFGRAAASLNERWQVGAKIARAGLGLI